MNVIEIEERIDEMLARGFKPADFIFDFIEAYGAPKSVIKQLRRGQQDAFGQAPVLWKRNVHFQLASEGQVGRVLTALAANKDTDKQKVRYIISTDGHDFGARDMKSGETLNCLFDELGVHFGFFLPLAGIERYKIADENPVDIKATGRLAKFYDSLLQDKPVKSREWFMVPRSAIKEAVDRLIDGSLGDTVYDPLSARLMPKGKTGKTSD